MLFDYNVDEEKKKKNRFPDSISVCVELEYSPHVRKSFLWFLPTSQRCACEANGMSKLSQSE